MIVKIFHKKKSVFPYGKGSKMECKTKKINIFVLGKSKLGQAKLGQTKSKQ